MRPRNIIIVKFTRASQPLHVWKQTVILYPRARPGVRRFLWRTPPTLTGCWRPLCRRLLREEFKSGRLEAAPSKAAALEQLCDRLKFEPDAASAIHKALFTERMETFLEDAHITGVGPPNPPPEAAMLTSRHSHKLLLQNSSFL